MRFLVGNTEAMNMIPISQYGSSLKQSRTMCYPVILSLIFLPLSVLAKDIRDDAIICSSLYYILTSFPSNDPRYAQSLTSLQQVFDSIYSVHEGKITGKSITKGHVTRLRDKKAKYLGALYDRNPAAVEKEYIFCDEWRKVIADYTAKQNSMKFSENDDGEIKEYILSIPAGPDRDTNLLKINPKTKYIIKASFAQWTKMGRPTTTDLTEKLRNLIRDNENQHNKPIQPTPKSGADDG